MAKKKKSKKWKIQPKKRSGPGQPSKYKKEYCKVLIDYMDRGGTFSGFCGEVRVAKSNVYDWVEKHKEFKEAKGIALGCHARWCDKQAREGMWGGKAFNPTVWIFMMKNMHGWKDKIEVSDYPEEEFVFVNE